MAVQDKYVSTEKFRKSRNDKGMVLHSATVLVSIAAADDDTSVYRVFENMSSSSIITNIMIGNTAITAGTDYDVGVYETGVGGAVVDKDIFADGLDLSSAHIRGAEISGIAAVSIANSQKNLYTLLGKTLANNKMAYDICLTANTVGTADGTILVTIEYLA